MYFEMYSMKTYNLYQVSDYVLFVCFALRGIERSTHIIDAISLIFFSSPKVKRQSLDFSFIHFKICEISVTQ